MGFLKWGHKVSGKDQPAETVQVDCEPSYRQCVCDRCGGGGWLDGGGQCPACAGKGYYFKVMEISIVPKRRGG